MANPLIRVGGKLVIDAFSDPEKFIKIIFFGLIVPLLIILLVFTFPIIFLISVPSILFDQDGQLLPEQIEKINLYKAAPDDVKNEIQQWIDEQKKAYSWCDDIVVHYSFNLSWQELMTIDAVLLGQDFSKANRSHIIEIGLLFVQKSIHTETYTKTETVTVTTPDGKSVTETVEVTKTRAIITVSKKSFERVLDDLGMDADEKEVAQNIYNIIQYSDEEGNLGIFTEIDLSDLKEYPPGNANIPYFHQADRRWGALSYGRVGTIASSGCGPTCLAMVVAGITGNMSITPDVVAKWSVENGHRIEGSGSAWSLMTEGGRYFGLKVEAVSRMNPEKVIKALSEGKPVIVSMGVGHFTKTGHFIVLRGLDSDGKILVYDPISTQRSTAWEPEIIFRESSTVGGIYGSPFWIFSK